MTLDLFGNQSASAQAILPKVLRANERGQSPLAQHMVANARLKPLYTSGGIYLGDFPTVKLEDGSFGDVLAMMVRGLYYYEHKERLQDDYQFDARRIHLWDVSNLLQRLQSLHPNGPYAYGSEFSYMYLRASEDRFTTFWIMWFFDRVCFSVGTVQPGIVLSAGKQIA